MQTSCEVHLKTKPEGLPGPEHFEFALASLPAPTGRDVLVRNLYFLVSPSLRMMVSEGAEAVQGVPFPALRPGDTLRAAAVGQVVAASAESGLAAGDVVEHYYGWRQYVVASATECRKLGPALPEPAGYAGYLSHGATAYAALTRAVQVRSGDTVFVSSAAGAIGSMAGQIARLLGAGRVIGSTSTREKADKLVGELGYDAAVVRGDGIAIAPQLAEAAPKGVDVFLDTVGGEQLQAAVTAAHEGARFVILGALSGQLAPRGTGRTAPVLLDSFQILLKKLTIRGYSADDDPDTREEWHQRFAGWLRAGRIRFPHIVIDGLENAPAALRDASRGKYCGSVIVKLAQS